MQHFPLHCSGTGKKKASDFTYTYTNQPNPNISKQVKSIIMIISLQCSVLLENPTVCTDIHVDVALTRTTYLKIDAHRHHRGSLPLLSHVATILSLGSCAYWQDNAAHYTAKGCSVPDTTGRPQKSYDSIRTNYVT